MANVFEEHRKLEEAFSGDAWSLLRSPFSRVYVAMLNAAFPDRSRPVRTETLHASVDAMLEELYAAGYSVPMRGGRPAGGRELCSDQWMNELRLIEKFELDDGSTEYRLRSTTISALDAVDRMGSHDVVLSSPRIETIAREISKLALLISGDPAARRKQLEDDLAAAKEALAQFEESGGVVESTDEEIQARLMNVVDLLRAVPADMRQIEERLGHERDELVDEFRTDERPHGEVIADYLARGDVLFNGTDSGQLYNGAIAMFADGALDAEMHEKVRNIAVSEAVKGSPVAARYDIRTSWEAVSDGMAGVFSLRSRCSRTIANAIGSYDMSKYRVLNKTLKQLETLMWEQALEKGHNGKSLMYDPLPETSIECIQRKVRGPEDHVPPPPLSISETPAPTIDLERLRMLGGPFTKQVLASFSKMLHLGETASAADLFASLDKDLRRDVEVLGLIRFAQENNLIDTDAPLDRYECIDLDGTRRIWQAPRIMIVRSAGEERCVKNARQ